MISFKDKILLITGGTGSFGNAVLRRFLTTDIAEIRILSRDEKKQDDMRHTYQELYPQHAEKIKFYIGDVRDYNSILNGLCVPRRRPQAGALLRVLSHGGGQNQCGWVGQCDLRLCCKPCEEGHLPVHGQGGLSHQRYGHDEGCHGEECDCPLQTDAAWGSSSVFDAVWQRYGLPWLGHSAVLRPDRRGKTSDDHESQYDPFYDDPVLYAFEHGEQGDLFVQKAPAATIETLAQAVLELKHSDLGTTIIGTRHGEKLFEVLVTAEEMMRAEDLPGFFRIPADNRDLNYDNYFSKGNPEFGKIEQYTSHNTHRLDVEEMKQLLLKLKLFGGTC